MTRDSIWKCHRHPPLSVPPGTFYWWTQINIFIVGAASFFWNCRVFESEMSREGDVSIKLCLLYDLYHVVYRAEAVIFDSIPSTHSVTPPPTTRCRFMTVTLSNINRTDCKWSLFRITRSRYENARWILSKLVEFQILESYRVSLWIRRL